MLQALARGLPNAVADSKPGGRSGPPDETTVFLNMLPVVIPCIFLVAILIVVIALRYFNAIAEQTPEGERVRALRSLHAQHTASRALILTLRVIFYLQHLISTQTSREFLVAKMLVLLPVLASASRSASTL